MKYCNCNAVDEKVLAPIDLVNILLFPTFCNVLHISPGARYLSINPMTTTNLIKSHPFKKHMHVPFGVRSVGWSRCIHIHDIRMFEWIWHVHDKFHGRVSRPITVWLGRRPNFARNSLSNCPGRGFFVVIEVNPPVLSEFLRENLARTNVGSHPKACAASWTMALQIFDTMENWELIGA